MTDEKLLKANNLLQRINALKKDVEVLSSPNCNSLYISIREHYNHASHQLSTGIVDVKSAHLFLKTAYMSALVSLEKEYGDL